MSRTLIRDPARYENAPLAKVATSAPEGRAAPIQRPICERSDTSRSQIRNRGIMLAFENDIATIIRAPATTGTAERRPLNGSEVAWRCGSTRPHEIPAIEATSGITGAKNRHDGIQSPPAM